MTKKTIIKALVIIIVSLAVGFFAGMEYKAWQIRSALGEITEITEDLTDFTDTGESQQTTPETQQEDFVFINKSIGDEIELATVKFKVNEARETQTLTGGFGSPAIAKENAKFVVVDLSISNTTNANFTFIPGDGFVLIDDKERMFSAYGDTIGNVDNYLNVRELAPSITERGVLVYEIPQDALNYGLVVVKGGTDEIYNVILK